MKRAFLLASVLAGVAASIIGQRSEVGKRPSEVLDPKTVKSIQQPLAQRIESEQQSVDRQLSRLSGQMQVVVEELRELSQAQGQIAVNTQATADLQRRISALEDRVISDEKVNSTDPGNIQVLNTKVDGLLKVGGWILGTTGTLLIGAAIAFAKRLHSGGIVTMKWAKQDAEHQDEARNELVSKVDEAIREANTVNKKIETIGMHMNDNKPLEGEENA